MDAAVDYKTAAAAHAQVAAAKRPAALKRVPTQKRFQVLFESIDAELAPEAFSETQQAALTRARAIMDAKWQGGEIKTRLELIRRLTHDARAVFGTGQLVVTDKRAGTTEWQQKP